MSDVKPETILLGLVLLNTAFGAAVTVYATRLNGWRYGLGVLPFPVLWGACAVFLWRLFP